MGRYHKANGGSKNCMGLPNKGKEQASDVNIFFKIMFGKDHTEVMYLPPKFARTVTSLVGQEISITNLEGQHWEVTISRSCDRSLAFNEGWPTFFRENNLRTGDLLVFQHLSGKHFEVDIFDRKNACLKTDFTTKGRTQTNKRSTKSPEVVPLHTTNVINIEDEPCAASALKLRSKPQNIPKTLITPLNAPVINLEEDTMCMINRDVDYGQGGPVDISFDLLSFELKNKKSDGENIEKTNHVPLVHVEQTETNGKDTGYSEPFDDANSNNAMPGDVYKPSTGAVTGFFPSDYMSPSTSATSNAAKRENAFMANPFDEYSLRSSFPIPNTVKDTVCVKKELMESRNKVGGFAHMLSRGSEGFLPSEPVRPSVGSTSQVAKQKNAFTSGPLDTLTRSSFPLPNFGATKGFLPSYSPSIGICDNVRRDNAFMSKPFDYSLPSSSHVPNFSVEQVCIKKELLESRETHVGFGQVSHGNFPNMATNFGQTSSPIVKNEPGLSNHDAVPLFAPRSFSVIVKSQSYLELPVCISSSNSGESNVVTLRDATRRLWPVIYTDLYVTKAFTGNWKSFCEANGVEPGDTCEFQPENNSFCDFGVIVHKSRSTS